MQQKLSDVMGEEIASPSWHRLKVSAARGNFIAMCVIRRLVLVAICHRLIKK